MNQPLVKTRSFQTSAEFCISLGFFTGGHFGQSFRGVNTVSLSTHSLSFSAGYTLECGMFLTHYHRRVELNSCVREMSIASFKG
ncbi:hypothetical protein SAMN04489759_108146 [Sulfitobacter delicatus]|uniref:Uncharacterized protein n=1 Tax=Sulfitobacter delicatus TaxID=218672 RepID=A0A1G7UX99_9RHOB|nr:hypothetical protein SAMN04489759_108146 [Sulfitobacter delicatus]